MDVKKLEYLLINMVVASYMKYDERIIRPCNIEGLKLKTNNTPVIKLYFEAK